MIAVQRGAAIVRVHDVAITRDALVVWAAVTAGDKPASRAKATANNSLWDED